MGKADEMIVVVPRSELFWGAAFSDELLFHGLTTEKDFIEIILSRVENYGQVKRRGDKNEPKSEDSMESNPDYKQIIPYVVLRRGNEVFAYQRLEGSGEQRLLGQVSVGVGGHMNQLSDDFKENLLLNVNRELDEELQFYYMGNECSFTARDSETEEIKVTGIINDDTNEVGQVHLGLVIVLNLVPEFEVAVRETDTLKGGFVPVEVLKQFEYDNLETWSRFVIDKIFA